MPNIKLTLEYDGSYFSGWQEQAHAPSIQEELHRALETVLREKIRVVQASGRTDAGVHARRQIANFHTTQTPDLYRLRHAVSSILRPKLAVLEAEFVPESFNALRDAKRKQYSYRIINRKMPLTLDHGRAWYCPDDLDRVRMRADAELLVGTHDFTSFRAADCDNPDPVKTILESELLVRDDELIYRIVGQGFLKHMVRTIVGTIVEIGKGTLERTIPEVFEARDRTSAGITAPAWGLYLDWVEY